MRDEDVVARYGGEEFGVILPNTPLAVARLAAERVRLAIMAKEIKKRTTQELLGRITISIGVVQLRHEENPTEFVERADACAYAAKQSGRNRVASEHVAEFLFGKNQPSRSAMSGRFISISTKRDRTHEGRRSSRPLLSQRPRRRRRQRNPHRGRTQPPPRPHLVEDSFALDSVPTSPRVRIPNAAQISFLTADYHQKSTSSGRRWSSTSPHSRVGEARLCGGDDLGRRHLDGKMPAHRPNIERIRQRAMRAKTKIAAEPATLSL